MGGKIEYTDPGLIGIFLYQLGSCALFALIPIAWILVPIFNFSSALYLRRNLKEAAQTTAFVMSLSVIVPLYITGKNIIFLLNRIISPFQALWRPVPSQRRGTDPDSDIPLRHDEPYQYESLAGETAIRLLRIFPGSRFEDQLVVELVTADLSYPPSYDALSYTWGDDTGNIDRSEKLPCKNGGIICITKNCEAAIRRLRLPRKNRLVWIDAVCIDQISNIERTHQVSLMSKIYKSAQKIIVYTGEGTSETAELFDWLNSIDENELDISAPWTLEDLNSTELQNLDEPARRQVQRRRAEFWFNDVMWRIRRVWRTSMISTDRIHLSDPQVQHLVREYCSRRWFRRVWVLQEVALPPINRIQVMCGTNVTTAERALHAISQLQGDELSYNILHIFLLFRRRLKNPKRSHHLDILIATRGREASDARDKIFAVLSIAQQMDESSFPKLKADYEKSTQEVYAEFSSFFIEHHGPAYFLSLIKSPSQLEDLPSWSAHWTVPWPNCKAVKEGGFAAGSRPPDIADSSAVFEVVDDVDDAKCLLLVRPKILRGYFTWNGHIDDSRETDIRQVEAVADDEVLVEMRPGIAALLKRKKDDYVFVRICPHALSEDGVHELVERWSTVLTNGEGEKSAPRRVDSLHDYLDPPQTFRVR
ncbi:HET-domain-containing protein [Rhizodiscina lignyota]|uniref:HET-domain-containing protein n=1 Tax=Rhizodiscina lignyota TaxID=1504668 RepID=A0A9P4IB52_9PEZI|nr:HET-domain-containing protein [Rhizodiscina lignyota]